MCSLVARKQTTTLSSTSQLRLTPAQGSFLYTCKNKSLPNQASLLASPNAAAGVARVSAIYMYII